MIAHPPVNGCTLTGAHDCHRSSAAPIVPPLSPAMAAAGWRLAGDSSGADPRDAFRCEGSGQLVAQLIPSANGWVCPVCARTVPLNASRLVSHDRPRTMNPSRPAADDGPTLGL